MRLLFLVSVFVLMGCGEEHNIHVNCVGAAEGFNCTAVHDQGSARVRACWRVNVTCANGTTTSGSTCADFDAGETIEKLIPMSEFPGSENCDRAANTEIVTDSLTAL